MVIDPRIQILAKCHVMSEGHPFKFEQCTLSRLIFHLKITLYTKFHVDRPSHSDFSQMSCHVMSEGHPVNLEKCTLSRSIFHLKITMYTKFHGDRPLHSDFSQMSCHVMSCQRVTHSILRNVPYPD